MENGKKILVVGASVAGPAVCYWLKHYGFSPSLIEISPSIRKGGFAIDIRGVAVDVASKMGIYQQVVKQRTQLTSGRYVDSEGNTLFEEQGEKFGFRQGDDVEIIRGDLVEILMAKIKEIPCYFSHSIKSISQDDNKVWVTFSDDRIEHYDLVIGADGLHSALRKQVFNHDEYCLDDLGYYISVFNVPNYLKLNHSEILFERNQKLVHVSSDKKSNVAQAGFMFRSNYQLQNKRCYKEQKKLLENTFRDLGWESNTLLDKMDNSDEFYFDSISQIKMKSWTKGRVALVGDAAFCASPLSGQGTSLALVGAYVLAGELSQSDGDHKLAFERYQQQMTPFVKANQEFGAWVSETFLIDTNVSKVVAEQRSQLILDKINQVANAMIIPIY